MMNGQLAFGEDFRWGAATAAYQIEGAVREDGRLPGIWDVFSRTPGKTLNGDTGDVACDHYHRMAEDLDLMAAMGLTSYRFSISWPRVIPDGRGPVNQPGLDFYSRLVDGLLERGISPLATLYHWDLPQGLQDAGGWCRRDTADHFARYAAVIGQALGDRVPAFVTLNEPWCSAFLGYGTGVHAPGIRDNAAALTAAHHLNLAHGRATTALRSVLPGESQVGTTLNLMQVRAADLDSAADQTAARHVDDIANRIFLDPVFRASYPASLIRDTAGCTDWSFVKGSDLAEIAVPIDFLGINYYQPARVAAPDDRVPTDSGADFWPGTDRAVGVPQPGPYTEMGWSIAPDALTALLLRVHADYPPIPLLITENGCAFADTIAEDGQVHDPDRIDYLRGHLAAVHAAIAAGVDVRGYYVWSLLDNFEWAMGYSCRFGVVYVDYPTQRRIVKDSGYWLRNAIAANAVDGRAWDGRADVNAPVPG